MTSWQGLNSFEFRVCSAQKWSCEVVGSHQWSQCNPVLCLVCKHLAFLIVDLTFPGQWNVFPVQSQPPCSDKFASCVLFANIWLFWLLTWHFLASGMFFHFEASHHAVVNLLGLRATLVLPMARARCHYCSSKPCWLFSQLEPRSLEQRQPPKNFIQLWDS